ncbi:MAG TPA: LON peptidase substrate-binding domain-containing protein [Bauldia sp.]|nr:LON peptidase substrate-binding domain-containing protein [Bauldia sp.]
MKAGNCLYGCAKDVPSVIPVFPLPEALLLPRADMPLNIFEPRYLAMVDAAMAGDRVLGMIQIDDAAPACSRGPGLRKVGCAGRIVSYAETGDGRYMITLTGIARFRIVEEMAQSRTPYRLCRVTAEPFAADFETAEQIIDRNAVLRAFRTYLAAHDLDTDWETVGRASNETLVNALAMMAPFGPAEKQALLEAPDLKARAETLVAIAEMTMPGQSTGRTLQ